MVYVFGSFLFLFSSTITVPTLLKSIFLRPPFRCFHYLYFVLTVTIIIFLFSFFLSFNQPLLSLSPTELFLSLSPFFSLFHHAFSLSVEPKQIWRWLWQIGLVQEPSSKSGDPLGLAVVMTYVKWSCGGYDWCLLAVVVVGFVWERALHTL